MGCCCSRAKHSASSPFSGQGHRLGTASDEREARAARAAAAEQRLAIEQTHEPFTDIKLSEEERAKIRAERSAAAEARMTKEEKRQMNQKKKETSDEPLRGPNTQNAMRWTAG
jgi:hypothetical protein